MTTRKVTSVRLTDEQRAAIDAQAAGLNMTRSEWLEAAVEAAIAHGAGEIEYTPVPQECEVQERPRVRVENLRVTRLDAEGNPTGNDYGLFLDQVAGHTAVVSPGRAVVEGREVPIAMPTIDREQMRAVLGFTPSETFHEFAVATSEAATAARNLNTVLTTMDEGCCDLEPPDEAIIASGGYCAPMTAHYDAEHIVGRVTSEDVRDE